jgi:hypothetical protein
MKRTMAFLVVGLTLIWIILWVAGHVISDPDLQHRADTLKEILEWIIGFLPVVLAFLVLRRADDNDHL